MKAKAKKWTWGAGLLLVLVGTGAAWIVRGHGSAPPANPPSPVPVRVVQPQTGGVERHVTRPGGVHSFQYANLYAKVSGFLKNQTVDIGDRVKQDQLLATIYAPEIQANVQKAQADLQKSQSQIQVMQARVEEAEADLKEAVANLAQKRADLESAKAIVLLRKPTNDRLTDEHFVKVAVGRDFTDVPPNKGVYRGRAAESIFVRVETRMLNRLPALSWQEQLPPLNVPLTAIVLGPCGAVGSADEDQQQQ